MDNTQERHIRLYFLASVIGKGIISAAEIVAGVLAFFIPVSVVTDFAIAWAQNELGENAHDIVANLVNHFASQLAVTSSTFIALYLLSRGLVKLALIVAMLKDKLWAYPWSLAVLGAFVAYQLYQIATSHSILLILLTIFDLIVMYFIWREYQVLKAHQV